MQLRSRLRSSIATLAYRYSRVHHVKDQHGEADGENDQGEEVSDRSRADTDGEVDGPTPLEALYSSTSPRNSLDSSPLRLLSVRRNCYRDLYAY